MLRPLLRTLRQPRYAALTAFMVLIAAVCVSLGTWQIARLGQKIHENGELRHNAHAAPVAVDQLLPLVGHGHTPGSYHIQFRHITATGTFDGNNQALVRLATVNGDTGYYVLTPLHTDAGDLLVVRGFLPTAPNPVAPPPPSGTVTVTARVEPGQTKRDDAGSNGQLESINPRAQAARLGAPVYNAYAELLAGQPGVGSLEPIPNPDLSNPAGGAVEPQHVAYIIQWYLFALLALAAPVAMARAETRHRDDREFDLKSDDAVMPLAEHTATTREPTPDEVRAAKLADRYGKAVR